MTAARNNPQASHEEHIAFGGYVRDGADHTVLAVRDHDAPWRLLDVSSERVTLIEPFLRDEEPDAVQAVAELYLAEMRS